MKTKWDGGRLEVQPVTVSLDCEEDSSVKLTQEPIAVIGIFDLLIQTRSTPVGVFGH